MKISPDDFAIVITNSNISIIPKTIFLQSLFKFYKEDIEKIAAEFRMNHDLQLITNQNSVNRKSELAKLLNKKFVIY